jgi:hypothetical protein
MTRFDLEQQILSCWNMVEDVKVLNAHMLDYRDMSQDEISNYLLGLETIYNVRFEQLFATFEKLIKEKKL